MIRGGSGLGDSIYLRRLRQRRPAVFQSAQLQEHACQARAARLPDPEEFKAWSQNLGHDKVLTTFLSYGQVESPRQGEIIRGLAAPPLAVQAYVSELAKALVREMRDSGVGPAVK